MKKKHYKRHTNTKKKIHFDQVLGADTLTDQAKLKKKKNINNISSKVALTLSEFRSWHSDS